MGKARIEYGDMGVQGHGSNPLGSLYLFCVLSTPCDRSTSSADRIEKRDIERLTLHQRAERVHTECYAQSKGLHTAWGPSLAQYCFPR